MFCFGSTVRLCTRFVTGVGFLVGWTISHDQYRAGGVPAGSFGGVCLGGRLRARALGAADALAARTSETVSIGTLHNDQVLIVHRVRRPETPLRHVPPVGALLPAHSTALGKVLLAADLHALDRLADVRLGGAVDRPEHSRLRQRTRPTIATMTELRSQLEQIRIQGWAVDIGETMPGEMSIAAPIHDLNGTTICAIAITGPIERPSANQQPRTDLLDHLREATRALEAEPAPAHPRSR